MATMKEITYAQAINDALCEEMQRDENEIGRASCRERVCIGV